jgi:N-methylhydantoinase A
MSIRVAIDIGGGFADLAAIDLNSGEMFWSKTYTTPEDLRVCVKEVFRLSKLEPQAVSQLLHGQTLVINSILQRAGAKVGLITTKGFRDVLQLQRANRRDIFNLRYHKPEPFVPRSLRLEVAERTSTNGEVLTKISREELIAACDSLVAQSVDAIAICYINSYANPENEYRSREILEAHLDQYAAANPSSGDRAARPYLTISSDVCREWREYERTSTAVLNAYVMPLMERYVTGLSHELRSLGIPGTLYMMLSNGGVASFDYATRRPIETVESGPVAGIVGAVRLGEWIGERHLIALDGGSTTTKASLIQNGEIRYMSDYAVERDDHRPGYPIKVPVADVVEIGVGGNSLAWIDQLGELKVGPRNAGATVGPVAYGRGGTEPTITDAFITLGLMNPHSLLGGNLPVNKALADEAIARIGKNFGAGALEAAAGIVRVAADKAAQMLRLISVQRGYDPRDFCLLTYGGSGPMISAFIARELKIPRVLIPAIPPGNFSAWGLLMSDLKHTAVRTKIRRLDAVGVAAEIEDTFLNLEAEVGVLFAEEGVHKDIVLIRMADVRYYGQEHTIRVPLAAGTVTQASLVELGGAFSEHHDKEYGFTLNTPIELVNAVIVGTATVGKPVMQSDTAIRPQTTAQASSRTVYWQDLGEITTPILQRSLLAAGEHVSGPAIIEEATSTVVVPPDFAAFVDPHHNLILHEKRR